MKGSITVVILAILAVVILVGASYWSAVNVENTFRIDNIGEEVEREDEIDLSPTSISLAPKTVALPDGTNGVFRIAEDFDIAVAAEDLGKARFMAMSPDGRLFVPDLVDYNLSHAGRLFALGDFNEETKQFETKHTYLSNLRGPNSVVFYTDKSGQTWLYLALTEHLLRYPYEAGDVEPSGKTEVVTTFPNTQSETADSVVWHITRTILFQNDKLYISIGSGCNSCEQLEGALRGMVTVMNPDGSDVEVYADGLRNAVGLTWANVLGDRRGALYATENGIDHLGPNAPDERLFRIEKGEHYGWPYCYELGGVAVPDTSTVWEKSVACEEAPRPLSVFTPRSAPLGVTYFDSQSHDVLRNSFLVALHGSFDPGTQAGYEVMRVTEDGEQETFMDGFQLTNGTRIGRPVAFLQKDNNSFFFTDDFAGRIYYVYVH